MSLTNPTQMFYESFFMDFELSSKDPYFLDDAIASYHE